MVLECRLDTTISAASKQEGTEGGRLFKMMAKSFSKRYDYDKLLVNAYCVTEVFPFIS
jgi:hypothetical protein